MWQQVEREKWEKLLQGTDVIDCAVGRHNKLFRDLWKSLQRELPASGENSILLKLFLTVLMVV